jgi:hypothetical protein
VDWQIFCTFSSEITIPTIWHSNNPNVGCTLCPNRCVAMNVNVSHCGAWYFECANGCDATTNSWVQLPLWQQKHFQSYVLCHRQNRIAPQWDIMVSLFSNLDLLRNEGMNEVICPHPCVDEWMPSLKTSTFLVTSSHCSNYKPLHVAITRTTFMSLFVALGYHDSLSCSSTRSNIIGRIFKVDSPPRFSCEYDSFM